MTQLQNFESALHFAFGMAALWILLFWLFRDYRIDVLRERLFAVRDGLFDYAATGNVSFDDPAYHMLRSLINSLIRFSHSLTFTRFLMGSSFTSWKSCPAYENPLLEWQRAVDALPTEQQKKLRQIHSEALEIVVRHLISGSPFMGCFLVIFVIGAILKGLTEKLLQGFTKTLSPQLDALQIQAIAADAADRQNTHDRRHPAMAH